MKNMLIKEIRGDDCQGNILFSALDLTYPNFFLDPIIIIRVWLCSR